MSEQEWRRPFEMQTATNAEKAAWFRKLARYEFDCGHTNAAEEFHRMADDFLRLSSEESPNG